MGPPGAGKTILSAQFLEKGIKTYGHNALYISFDVPKTAFLKQMKQFGFESFESNRFEFVDAAPIRLVATDPRIQPDPSKKGRVAIVSLCQEIEKKVEQTKAKRIVIDTLTCLSMLYDDIVERRVGILALFEALHKLRCTAVVTAEIGQSGVVEPEGYLSDGVIVLQTVQVGRSIVRSLQVEKMRETAIDMQPRPYRITPSGIEVFPKESIY